MRYRDRQGRRDIASLKVFCSQLIWNIQPKRAHWAKPVAIALGRSGVDVFLVIVGFVIYHITGRSAAQAGIAGHAWASYEFAKKRIGSLRDNVRKRPLPRIFNGRPDP